MYDPNVKMVWNGNAVGGVVSALEFLLDLPQSSHTLTGMDAQFLLRKISLSSSCSSFVEKERNEG